MGSANFTTQPQFSSNQTMASTEFVQRSCGNNSSAQIINTATYAMSAADAGAVLNAEVGCTFTLPLISDLIAAGNSGQGTKFIIKNGSTASSIVSQSPDTINAGVDGTTETSYDLHPYDSIEITQVDGAVDGNWIITGGTAQSSNSGSFEE